MRYESPIAVDNTTTCMVQSVRTSKCHSSPVLYINVIVQHTPVTISVKLPLASCPPIAVT